MLTLEYLGTPRTHQRIVPGNTAIGTLSTSIYYTEWTVAFTGAGTTTTSAGQWIVGATSGVVAQVVSISVTSGTFAGGDAAGTMRLKSKFHPVAGTTNWTSGENWKIAAGTDEGTFTGIPAVAPRSDLYAFPYKQPAKSALVTVLTNTQLTTVDGSTPDQTALVGDPMKDGSSRVLRDLTEIINFKTIDYVASSAGVVNITYFF